ncbi:MAG: NUDIX domain-containing protein [Sphaerochaetaceae bacterium]
MEKWDVYDCCGNKTGRTMERGQDCKPGEYHRVAHVCVFNSKGGLLIQKRTDTKEVWPGMWDLSAGGSVLAGEDSLTAAKRETHEELGLEVSLDCPVLTIYSSNAIHDYYIVVRDLHRDEIHLQEEEVAEVRGANERDIREMIKEGAFIPYHVNLVKLLFDLRHGTGPHTTR